MAVVEAAGEDVNLLGHSHGGVCALEAALLTKSIRKLVLYEAPVGFLETPPHVVERLQTLLDEDRRDELLAFFMAEVAGLPPDQIALMRALPAWQARLDAAATIPREELANREYVFEPARCQRTRRPNRVSPGRRQLRAIQSRRTGASLGSAGLRGGCDAGPAARRDGYRHRAVRCGSADLPGSCLDSIPWRTRYLTCITVGDSITRVRSSAQGGARIIAQVERERSSSRWGGAPRRRTTCGACGSSGDRSTAPGRPGRASRCRSGSRPPRRRRDRHARRP